MYLKRDVHNFREIKRERERESERLRFDLCTNNIINYHFDLLMLRRYGVKALILTYGTKRVLIRLVITFNLC